jgi:tRNA (adenine22-N1)-methyltransferase
MIELNGRLKAIADFIPSCETLIDVGTDHAYIPIYAAGKGLCKRAVASDVRKGPVEAASKNVRLYGMEESVSVRLGYGLDSCEREECGVIVIAGMGGLITSEILQKGCEKAQSAVVIILQPMTDVESLRKWLFDNGFSIIKEALAAEEEKIYNIICCKWTGSVTRYDDFGIYIGNALLSGGDPLLARFLEKKLKQVEVIIKGRQMSRNAKEAHLDWEFIKERLLEELGQAGSEGKG